jgi:alpha-beta hydrolase superfamily lysophospholipase
MTSELKQRLETVLSIFSFENLAPDVRAEIVPIKAQDGGDSRGVVYYKGLRQPDTVVMVIHPRTDSTRHYAIPGLVEAGVAAFGHNTRWINNDIETIHERLALDVAAAVKTFRERGYKRVVLLGNSGGGALYTFYQAQAARPGQRVTATPAGDPPNLNDFEMPEVDGVIQLATHAGPGRFLQNCIDPSVTDEHDPLSVDPRLDMYDSDNGYRTPPEPTTFSTEFLQRFREGQRNRVLRLDAIARQAIDEQRRAEALIAADGFARLSTRDHLKIRQRAAASGVMTIWRTMADPGYVDMSIDPSDRDRGSIRSTNPETYNYTEFGYARVLTPRAWLSSWSGGSCQVDTIALSRYVTVPTLHVGARCDREVLPQKDTLPIYENTAGSDKQLVWIDGADHFFRPSPHSGKGDERERTLGAIAAWLRDRFS